MAWSGISTFHAEGYGACTSPVTTRGLVSTGHTYYFYIYLIDRAGNTRTSTYTWTLDTTRPVVRLTQHPPASSRDRNPTFEFDVNEELSSLSCYLNNNLLEDCASPMTIPNLSDGTYTFEIRAQDLVGNQTTVPYEFSVDNIAPRVDIINAPSGVTTGAEPIEFETSGEASSVECRLGSEEFRRCFSPYSLERRTNYGPQTFVVRVTDSAGNFSETSHTFTLAPVATIDQSPVGLIRTDTPVFEFTTTFEATEIICRVGTSTISNCTSPVTISLEPGIYRFNLTVTDITGSRRTINSNIFEIDPCFIRFSQRCRSIQNHSLRDSSSMGSRLGFGMGVSVSGNTMAVGDYINDGGSVYIYQRERNIWHEQAMFSSSTTDGGDLFGWSVSLFEDTLAVGAWAESSAATGVDGDQSDNSLAGSGAVYIFERNGTEWTQQAYIKASNPDVQDLFGFTVSLSGDTLAVGAHLEDSSAIGIDGDQFNNNAENSGAAYIFVRDGTTWRQQAYIKASNTDAEDHFGFALSLFNNTLVVGAGREDSSAIGIDGDDLDNSRPGSGAVYVFVREQDVWRQQAYVKSSTTSSGFGDAVALYNNSLVVGAPFEGAAYVFQRDGEIWQQQSRLTSDQSSSRIFGSSVAIYDDTIVVGMPRGRDSRAFIFRLVNGVWHQEHALGANLDSLDAYADTVSISGDIVVVNGESSNQRTVHIYNLQE